MPAGWFDPTAVPASWFDDTATSGGWFDPDSAVAVARRTRRVIGGRLILPIWAVAPTSGISAGYTYFNSTLNSVEVYDGTKWVSVARGALA